MVVPLAEQAKSHFHSHDLVALLEPAHVVFGLPFHPPSLLQTSPLVRRGTRCWPSQCFKCFNLSILFSHVSFVSIYTQSPLFYFWISFAVWLNHLLNLLPLYLKSPAMMFLTRTCSSLLSSIISHTTNSLPHLLPSFFPLPVAVSTYISLPARITFFFIQFSCCCHHTAHPFLPSRPTK